jgi:hypothetical protein
MIIIFLSGSSLFAVDFKYGVKGGINLSNFGGNDAEIDGVVESDIKVGYTTGLFGTLFLKDTIAIQPEVLFTLKGERAVFFGVEASHNNLYYIDIPLLLKLYLPEQRRYSMKPNLFVGPYLGINLWNRAKAKDELADALNAMGENTEVEYEDVKKLDYGLVFGFGVDFSKLLLEGRYSLGLTTTDDSVFDLDLKNRTVAIMLGLRI